MRKLPLPGLAAMLLAPACAPVDANRPPPPPVSEAYTLCYERMTRVAAGLCLTLLQP